MAVKFVNVSNPAAFGVEWVAGDTGNTYQLCTSRGAFTLWFGVRLAGERQWHQNKVISPERFGMTGPVRSFAEFRKIAESFVNG